MAKFHGIEVYEILDNGNLLNGIYSYTDHYIVQNEIAKKIEPRDSGIIGTYNARYIETGNPTVTDCILEIAANGEAFEFKWTQNGTTIWTGIGLMAGENHIAVAYR